MSFDQQNTVRKQLAGLAERARYFTLRLQAVGDLRFAQLSSDRAKQVRAWLRGVEACANQARPLLSQLGIDIPDSGGKIRSTIAALLKWSETTGAEDAAAGEPQQRAREPTPAPMPDAAAAASGKELSAAARSAIARQQRLQQQQEPPGTPHDVPTQGLQVLQQTPAEGPVAESSPVVASDVATVAAEQAAGSKSQRPFPGANVTGAATEAVSVPRGVHFFYGKDSPFSQFHAAPFKVDGVKYQCAEQFMMAEKARLFGDNEMRAKILEATIPLKMKQYGRRVRNFDSNIWEEAREDVVFRGNKAKFEQNPDLREALLRTAPDLLAEANPRDRIWGIGLSAKVAAVTPRGEWPGKNRLGKVLMRVRDALAAEGAEGAGARPRTRAERIRGCADDSELRCGTAGGDDVLTGSGTLVWLRDCASPSLAAAAEEGAAEADGGRAADRAPRVKRSRIKWLPDSEVALPVCVWAPAASRETNQGAVISTGTLAVSSEQHRLACCENARRADRAPHAPSAASAAAGGAAVPAPSEASAAGRRQRGSPLVQRDAYRGTDGVVLVPELDVRAATSAVRALVRDADSTALAAVLTAASTRSWRAEMRRLPAPERTLLARALNIAYFPEDENTVQAVLRQGSVVALREVYRKIWTNAQRRADAARLLLENFAGRLEREPETQHLTRANISDALFDGQGEETRQLKIAFAKSLGDVLGKAAR